MFFRTALFALTTLAGASAIAATSVSNASFVNGLAIPGSLLDLSTGSDFDRRVGFFSDIYYDRNRNEWFRFISVGFVHADLMHLAFNMLTLYFFGSVLEGNIFSEAQYLAFYLSALVLSGANDYTKRKDMPNYTACGASNNNQEGWCIDKCPRMPTF